jgi:hypothetical protein
VKGLQYRQDFPGCWRFVDAETQASIGHQYRTRAELMVDLDRYAYESGFMSREDRPFKLDEEGLARAAKAMVESTGCDDWDDPDFVEQGGRETEIDRMRPVILAYFGKA